MRATLHVFSLIEDVQSEGLRRRANVKHNILTKYIESVAMIDAFANSTVYTFGITKDLQRYLVVL